VVCWQLTLCDPHLSALEVRFSRRCAIQIDVYLPTFGQKCMSAAPLVGVMVGVGMESRLLGMINDHKELQ